MGIGPLLLRVISSFRYRLCSRLKKVLPVQADIPDKSSEKNDPQN